MEHKEFFINCDGVRLHAKLDFPIGYKGEGEKCPLLVVIHGLTGHMEETHIIATAKAANEVGFASLRVEMYGHGASEGAFVDHTILKWMTEAMQVIDYARNLDFVTDLYLAGHSQGGLTTILTAGIMGDYLKAILPLSPATAIKDHAINGCILGEEFDPKHIPDRLHLRDDFYLGGNYLRAARVLPIDECIAAYKKPVLIIHGTKDEAIDFSYAEKLVGQYANASLKVIPDDTHCYDLHLDLVVSSVKEFLTAQNMN